MPPRPRSIFRIPRIPHKNDTSEGDILSIDALRAAMHSGTWRSRRSGTASLMYWNNPLSAVNTQFRSTVGRDLFWQGSSTTGRWARDSPSPATFSSWAPGAASRWPAPWPSSAARWLERCCGDYPAPDMPAPPRFGPSYCASRRWRTPKPKRRFARWSSGAARMRRSALRRC